MEQLDLFGPMEPDVPAVTWRAMGFTDDVTDCQHCPKTDLKGTVRMVAFTADGEEDGEMFVGTTCAARMTGRKANEIRTEANRADRARIEKIRQIHRAWSSAHSGWFCALRDQHFGRWAHAREIFAWADTPEVKALEAAWLAEHPEPPRP